MDSSISYASPGLDTFLAAILDKTNPADTAAFTAAILDECNPADTAAFAARLLGEHNFNPNEPRDEKGRWTTGGSYNGWPDANMYRIWGDSFDPGFTLDPEYSGDPGLYFDAGVSGDPDEDAARKELDREKKKAEDQAKKGLNDLFKGADEAKKGPDVGKWKSSQTGNGSRNAKILRKNMEAKGVHFKPGEQPHHIVQSTDPRAQTARELLDKYHIDVNSAENGLKLPSRVHQTSGFQQTKAINAVTSRLGEAARGAKDWGAARRSVLSELSKLKQAIASGKFPCP